MKARTTLPLFAAGLLATAVTQAQPGASTRTARVASVDRAQDTISTRSGRSTTTCWTNADTRGTRLSPGRRTVDEEVFWVDPFVGARLHLYVAGILSLHARAPAIRPRPACYRSVCVSSISRIAYGSRPTSY